MLAVNTRAPARCWKGFIYPFINPRRLVTAFLVGSVITRRIKTLAEQSLSGTSTCSMRLSLYRLYSSIRKVRSEIADVLEQFFV
jgi:hypothetical protein